MLPKHFYAAVHGYLKKEYKASSDLRRVGFLAILPHTEKHKFSFQKFCDDFWPLQLDEEFMDTTEVVAVSPLAKLSEEERKKEFLKIMHQHNPSRYKEQNHK